MTVAELLQGLAEYPPDALVMFTDNRGLIGPVRGLEAQELAHVEDMGTYHPLNSLVLQGLTQIGGFHSVRFPAAVMVL